MKKSVSLIILSVLFLGFIGFANACHDGDYECTPLEQTLIKGKVTFEDSGDIAKWADVTITCHHEADETDYTRTTHTLKYGTWKGWYFVYFPQSQCVAGDEVTVHAEKNGLTGEVTGLVQDFMSGKCFDLDLARIDVPLVPEFGTIVMMLTALSALGIFFTVRRSK